MLFGPSPICLSSCATSRFFVHRELWGHRTNGGWPVWKQESQRVLQAYPVTTRGSLEVP